MNKEEWKDLIKSICIQKIIPKIRKLHSKYHPYEFYQEFSLSDRKIYRASRTIRFIDDNFDDNENLCIIFNKNHLDDTLDDLRRGTENINRLLLKNGISDVIEEFYEEIVDGMDISDIPEADFDALREAGSQDPKGELHISIVRTKKIKEKFRYNSNESVVRYSLKESEKVIVRRKSNLSKCNADNPPTKKKILKGLGGICRGVILTGVDIGLMAGVWPVPLSPDATTVGAVASITTGIGDIMIAIGDLRGE